ncbi:hypothetical protein NDU88_004272 [Pleurodeles waltl]|uniref:Uncharacterized protein n=1 Tax=Pleurodeles waltl TaxID=8319 RepID=A0AAV7SID9_PLEWA|nr:hypothetical protein NDU88_004272 [Pleurodeles waltl]
MPGTSRAFDSGVFQEAGGIHKQIYPLFVGGIIRGPKETPTGPQLRSHNSVSTEDSLSPPVQYGSDIRITREEIVTSPPMSHMETRTCQQQPERPQADSQLQVE